jgi:hypothetical protein
MPPPSLPEVEAVQVAWALTDQTPFSTAAMAAPARRLPSTMGLHGPVPCSQAAVVVVQIPDALLAAAVLAVAALAVTLALPETGAPTLAAAEAAAHTTAATLRATAVLGLSPSALHRLTLYL